MWPGDRQPAAGSSNVDPRAARSRRQPEKLPPPQWGPVSAPRPVERDVQPRGGWNDVPPTRADPLPMPQWGPTTAPQRAATHVPRRGSWNDVQTESVDRPRELPKPMWGSTVVPPRVNPNPEPRRGWQDVEEKFEKYFGYLARFEGKFCTTTLKF